MKAYVSEAFLMNVPLQTGETSWHGLMYNVGRGENKNIYYFKCKIDTAKLVQP